MSVNEAISKNTKCYCFVIILLKITAFIIFRILKVGCIILELKKNHHSFLFHFEDQLPLVFGLFSEGVLKDYLRELPSPLITKQLYEAVLDAMAKNPLKMSSNSCENDPSDSKYTVDLLDCLPDVEKVS